MEAPTPKKLNCEVISDKNLNYNIELYSNSEKELQIDIKSVNNIQNISFC